MLCCPRPIQRDPRRGAAAVELAVMLPFLAFAFLLAVDYCRLFYYSMTITNCARNGAVYASNVCGTSTWEGNGAQYTSIQQAAIADGAGLQPPLQTSDVTVTNNADADGNPAVQVTVRYTFRTIANFPGIPDTVQVVRTVHMRVDSGAVP